ncbi:flagella basal body P-ring formation protein FlgA [Variovorax sp. RB2P76]|uniref:flagella basal body P-ring formation protein FlgA n=1 Tax=Variovorax sp. RB2P76 TaxID=3443736 RepID=UPI003F48E473
MTTSIRARAPWSLLLIGGACAWALAAGAQEPPAVVRIELRQDAGVGQRDVTLGEVANLSSRSLPALQRLMALPLGQLPRSGEAIALQRETVQRWIQLRLGFAADQMAWSGPESSFVRLTTSEVPGESIAEAARKELLAALSRSGLRAQVELTQSPRDVRVPGGRLDVRVRAAAGWRDTAASAAADPVVSSGTALLAKRQSVWVDLWVNDRFVRTVPVGFEVSVFAPGYVAAHDLVAGQTVDLSHRDGGQLMVRDVEWSGRASPPVRTAPPVDNDAQSSGAVQGDSPSTRAALRLRRPVTAGSALTRADVEEVPAIARGDYATLHAFQGAIELESRVEVLQDGIVGQPVRVKLPGASSAIMAKVTAPGQVEVRQ